MRKKRAHLQIPIQKFINNKRIKIYLNMSNTQSISQSMCSLNNIKKTIRSVGFINGFNFKSFIICGSITHHNHNNNGLLNKKCHTRKISN